MDKFKFYRIDAEYLKYLKGIDKQVADIVTDGYNKPYCGVVLEVNNIKYYAPISSYSKKQKTNFPIYDKDKIISSIRFCFMVPVIPDTLVQFDYNKEDPFYANLCEKEHRFCLDNIDVIYKKAEEVYKIGCNRSHPLAYTCCDFTKLEEGMKEYKNPINEGTSEVAAADKKDAK